MCVAVKVWDWRLEWMSTLHGPLYPPSRGMTGPTLGSHPSPLLREKRWEEVLRTGEGRKGKGNYNKTMSKNL